MLPFGMKGRRGYLFEEVIWLLTAVCTNPPCIRSIVASNLTHNGRWSATKKLARRK